MRAIAHAHVSTGATSLILIIVRTASVYDTYCLRHWDEKNETKIKSIQLNN